MENARVLALAFAALAASLLGFGCGPGSSGGDDAGPTATALVIEPQNPTVVAQNGSASPIAFTAILKFSDGSTQPVDAASWSLDNARLGAIAADSGKFIASGDLAGTTQVKAAAAGLTAQATVTVLVEDTFFGVGVPSDAGDRFTPAPTAGAGAPLLLYPLDRALVPSSLKAPDVQWDGGAQGDIYRVTLVGGMAKATAYVIHDGPMFAFAWPVDPSTWTTLKASTGTGSISFTVDRYAAAEAKAYASATHTIDVAQATVAGAIYYWDLSEGRIQRITALGRQSFMPNPPARPSDGRRCVGCHTVSRDGRYLAGELWDGGDFGAIFDLGVDLSSDPAPTVVPPSQYKALFSTFNPDASRLLVNYETGMFLHDAKTGAALPALGNGLPIKGAAHPTWSPDGTTIAYIANHNGGWAVDYSLGDLAIIPVTGPDSFGAPQVIRIAEGLANSWPTFSPDSYWIAFGRGTNSRGRNDSEGKVYPGSLWLIPRTGGVPIELTSANGGAGVLDSYLPSFSPFDEGGYYWLAFYSTRDYGNQYAGTRGKNRRQLWVSAIKKNPVVGEDPSRVGYWLPDQDVKTHNMSAYWAPAPPLN
jgi:hypothetical protein